MLGRLTGILEKFPLPAGSPQGELVAAGITQRCSLSERKVRRTDLLWPSPSHCHAECHKHHHDVAFG